MSDCPSKLQLIPLHTHTVYSVLDGVSNLDQYIKWCKDNGAPALGISDHGWAIGLAELFYKCQKAGLISLPGIEFYVAPDRDYKFAGKPFGYFHVTAWAVTEQGYRNLLKLASLSWAQDTLFGYRTEKGKLIESQVPRVIKRFGSEKPRITIAELLQHNEGIVLGSGCLIGLACKSWLQGENDQAERNIEKILSVYRGRFFAELMPHCVDTDWDRESKQFKKNECNDFAPDGDVQKSVNLKMIELARRQKLPLLMTVDAHMVDHTEKLTQDCVLSQGDPTGWKFSNTYAMLTTDQAWEHWKERYGSDEENRKIFAEAVENNHQLADMAKGLKIQHRFHQPPPEIPQDVIEITQDQKEQRKVLIMRAIERHGRMRWDDAKYTDRLKMELAVICDNGVVDFADYFLFLEKWAVWSRDHSVLSGAGRGSAGGSLLAYLLKITHLDPIQWDLPFERFLSMARIGRGKFPDIDWDMDSRDLVVAAVKEFYGDRYAQVSTHGTLKIKFALKDAARFLLGWSSSDSRIESITESIPNTPMGVKDIDFLLGYTDSEGNQHQGHLEQNPTLQRFFTLNPEVKDMVLKLLGIPRSIGRHASAVIISDEPVSHTVPTCVVSKEPCTQYVASGDNYVEKSGLIKFDFLTVNTMKYASDCIRLIQREYGFSVWSETVKLSGEEFTVLKGELSIEQIPTGPKGDPNTRFINAYELPELPEVFDDIKNGRTESLFQLSTPGMTEFCKRVKPNSIKEIAHIVALDRPGPLDALSEDGQTTFADLYILRKGGVMPVQYTHPDLEPILKDTFGVWVLQEQLQKSFQVLAGYTAEEADQWREMLAKKKKQDVEKFVPELRKRLQDRGWSDQQTQVFVNACIAASQYSFNASHALCYGYNAYVTAFLKNKYPLQWWTAVLSNAKLDHIKEKQYDRAVKDILILPHANGPMQKFELKDGKIHAPLYLLDGVGDGACEAIRAELAVTNQPYCSLQDFFERVKHRAAAPGIEPLSMRAVTSKVITQMILCGCFDLIEPNRTRRELLYLYYYLDRVSGLKAGRGKTQTELLMAAQTYQQEHPDEAFEKLPALKLSDLEVELHKSQSLPIYRCDVYEKFKEILNSYLVYDGQQIYRPVNGKRTPAARSSKDLEAFLSTGQEWVVWCGLLKDSKHFSYQDKKTNQQVTALKLQVANNGDQVECVLWPKTLDQFGAPIGTGIQLIVGNIKRSRLNGTPQIFVQHIQEVE